MNYEDKKIVAIIASNVEAATALNVIGHLAIAIGKYSGSEIMGRPVITDKSGGKHMGISQFPFIVTKVKAGKLKNAIERAKCNSNLLVADYTREILETRTDDDLAKAMAKKDGIELEYMGAIIYGDTKDVDEITGKFSLWRAD